MDKNGRNNNNILFISPGSVFLIPALNPTISVRSNSVTKDITQQSATYYQTDSLAIVLEPVLIHLDSQYWTSWYKVILFHKHSHNICWIDGRSVVDGKKLYKP